MPQKLLMDGCYIGLQRRNIIPREVRFDVRLSFYMVTCHRRQLVQVVQDIIQMRLLEHSEDTIMQAHLATAVSRSLACIVNFSLRYCGYSFVST